MILGPTLVFAEFREILTVIPNFFSRISVFNPPPPPNAGFRELKGVVQWIDDLAKTNSREDWLISVAFRLGATFIWRIHIFIDM